MTMTIEIPETLADDVRAEAEAAHVSVNCVIARRLAEATSFRQRVPFSKRVGLPFITGELGPLLQDPEANLNDLGMFGETQNETAA